MTSGGAVADWIRVVVGGTPVPLLEVLVVVVVVPALPAVWGACLDLLNEGPSMGETTSKHPSDKNEILSATPAFLSM